MPKLRIVRFSAVADCIGCVAAGDFDAESFRKHLDVLDEIAQQDELAEFLEREPRIPGQPISNDFGFGFQVKERSQE